MSEDLLGKLSLEQKVRLLTGEDFWSLYPEPAVGLRKVVLSDGPAGVRGTNWDERDRSANIPSPTALAASWDVGLVQRLGRLLAAEARRKNVDVLLAPTVNLHRSPLGGRHFEAYSEDPLLSGEIGAAYVRGVQSGGVAATVKHFVANDSETERMSYDVTVDDRALREVYLAPFERIVAEGVWAVMAAYNAVAGATMTESPLLRDVLQDEWGFDGVVMSDWFATRSTVAAGNAGLDLAMPGPISPWGDALVAAVRDGSVPESRIDDKVRRLLRLAERVGALDGIAPAVPLIGPAPDAEVAALSREAAARGMVLVKNAGVLPLSAPALRKVAVIGPNAVQARTMGGGSASVSPTYTVTPLAGLSAALGEGVEVVAASGCFPSEKLDPVPLEQVTDPVDGTPGLRVRFVDETGAPLAEEHRESGQLTYLGSFAGAEASRVSAIEIATRYTALVDGDHLLGAAGVGQFRLTVDGHDVLDQVIDPPGPDLVEAMMNPDQAYAPVRLAAGGSVDVVLRYELPAGNTFAAAMLRLVAQPPRRTEDDELEHAVALAASADAVVLAVGTNEEVESEGYDRAGLALPGRQDELVRRVLAANPRTVVVVNSGAPVVLPWLDEAPAVLLSWFAGMETGNALADVLLGAEEPGGRLPTTWPAAEDDVPVYSTRPVDGGLTYTESIHVGHRGWLRSGAQPAFWFGHGLGYTTWAYSAAAVGGNAVEVTVQNTGSRSGREVVQVYASRPESAVDRPARWLVGFAVVSAAAGSAATVRIPLPARAFEHWSGDGWEREPGPFTLHVGRSVVDTPLTLEA
ncbi:beta-glucosidase family protein [Cryptosporangium aurantiacum]|uniref:Beta-glucosidase n=1 Tax=Cryptosporangium aurantiacum TaxID=134849 RepID=A0A1M7RJA8_9ACTN|nr:glycoside hydrolase family 3 C-terminal domain-containing protein [Cryptosporangium aurantiacum]SHN46239.1 beta-glucosidase [Cryptosporangium aurantiacum]